MVPREHSDEVEEMLMIDPDFFSRITGRTCLQVMNMAFRLSSNSSSHISASSSVVGLSPRERPTLLCSTSMRP